MADAQPRQAREVAVTGVRRPRLPTVRQPTVQMGRQMASRALGLADRPHAHRARALILSTELVTRPSA